MNSHHCSVEECSEPSVARGLCWKHYGRRRRHGSVDVTKRRYRMPPECRFCGTAEPGAFYPSYKSVCKQCRKVQAIQREEMRVDALVDSAARR